VLWKPDDRSVPLQQGDLLLVAWAKTIEPPADLSQSTHPVIGARDAFSLRFWDGESPPVLEMWGCLNYGLAVVVADDCAIDKEFNTLLDRYLDQGAAMETAIARAHEDAEPYLTVAEAWPVEALPTHLQDGAESGAVGYVPFLLNNLIEEDGRSYTVDLNRISTISWRSIHRRLGLRDERWRQRLQTQLCRFFAARTIRVAEDLANIFTEAVVRAEALAPPAGSPPRTRARLHFADGRSVTLEAILGDDLPPDKGSARPGLHTREGGSDRT
jgi:hypothetical protein